MVFSLVTFNCYKVVRVMSQKGILMLKKGLNGLGVTPSNHTFHYRLNNVLVELVGTKCTRTFLKMYLIPPKGNNRAN